MTSITENTHTVASIFAELAKAKRWICWRKEMRNGEWSKIPRNPNVCNGNASSSNSLTWATYEDAKVYLRSSDATGMGLMLGGGLVGIDIDHCRNAQTGELSDLARDIVNTLDSYTEISPSGEGVHILIRTEEDFQPQWNKNTDVPDFEDHKQEVEIYNPVWTEDADGMIQVKHGRYFTFTGHPLDRQNVRPISERVSELRDVMAKYPVEKRKNPDAPSASASTQPAQSESRTFSADMTDVERWEWMFSWKNGSAIRALYNGDISAYGGDESRADQALCNAIAYATRHESGDRVAIIDRMFRQSGLYREKWERDDYRGWTINNALDSCPYEPLPQKQRKSPVLGPNGEPLPDFSVNEKDGTTLYSPGSEPPVLFTADGARTYGEGQYHHDVEVYSRSNDRKTGFANIDAHGPFRPGLYCIGAISSLGKSTFCLQLADNLAAAGENVLIFSVEQDKKSMHAKSVGRYLFDMTGDPHAPSGTALKSGVTGEQVRAAEVAYHEAVDDRLRVIPVRSKLRPKDLDYTVRYYTDKFGKPPVIIVDYIQRLKPDNPRDMERTAMNNVVATMQDLVLDLGVTAIGVSSLNRAGYLQPISFESFKESGDIEYDADVVWGLDLGCMQAPLFSEEKGAVKKRAIITMAKKEIPREVRLVCLKNRDGEPSYDALFYYYPTHEYFEALTLDDAIPRIVQDDFGNLDFIPQPGRKSWRNLVDTSAMIAAREAKSSARPIYDNVKPTGETVTLSAEMVNGWSSGAAHDYFITVTKPEERETLRRMLPGNAKKALLKKLKDGPKRFMKYTDTPELPNLRDLHA